MNMLKPFMKPELQKLVSYNLLMNYDHTLFTFCFNFSFMLSQFQYHQANSEGIYEFIPKSMLPKDYGGDAPCLEDLHGKQPVNQ